MPKIALAQSQLVPRTLQRSHRRSLWGTTTPTDRSTRQHTGPSTSTHSAGTHCRSTPLHKAPCCLSQRDSTPLRLHCCWGQGTARYPHAWCRWQDRPRSRTQTAREPPPTHPAHSTRQAIHRVQVPASWTPQRRCSQLHRAGCREQTGLWRWTRYPEDTVPDERHIVQHRHTIRMAHVCTPQTRHRARTCGSVQHARPPHLTFTPPTQYMPAGHTAAPSRSEAYEASGVL